MKKSSKEKTLIKVEGVYKTFEIPHERHTSLKSAAFNIFGKKSYTEFKSLSDISFEVKEGEFFGIIGRNGSGKSTLLKMLAGIYIPDKGKIDIHGRISPFLELGVGFNPELTGRENVYLNGAILGLTRTEIDEKYDEIVEFAELEEFMDQKLKNYSSGMQVRLAFAVSIKAHAEILLIDEVLAVGDTNFQKKCFNVFKKFKEEGKTIVFVSHAMESIKEFCDRVLVIHNSENIYLGNPEKAIQVYNTINFGNNAEAKLIEEGGPVESENRWGNFKLYVKDVSFLDGKGNPSKILKPNETFVMNINYEAKEDIEKFILGIGVFDDNMAYLFGTNSEKNGVKGSIRKGKGAINITFKNPSILRGNVYFDIRFAEIINGEQIVLDQINKVYKVYYEAGGNLNWGTINFETKFEKK